VKVFAAALTAVAALGVSGAAASSSSTCCRGTPIGDFDPQWSSDGSRIAFIRHEATGTNTGPSTLFTMAAGGGEVRPLMPLGEAYQPTFSVQSPLLSPDWTRLALIVRGAGQTSSSLRIESVDGSEVHHVGTSVFSFAWSPDSKHVAFHETDSGNNSTIFVVDSDGNGVRNLGPGLSPAWSPSGDRIAFVAPDGKLYAMEADGSDRTLLHDHGGSVLYAPSWSPQGDRIAFFGNRSLFVARADGALITQIPTDYDALKPPRWSFDGALARSSRRTGCRS
jgi:Tol biopolymer transport system component